MSGLQILKGPSLKDFPVRNLYLMVLAWLKMRLTLQVDVASKKNPLINILIQGTDRNAQFRLVGHNLIGGLPICDDWGDHRINGMEWSLVRLIPALENEHFFVFAFSKNRIVVIFGSNCAAVQWFKAATADIRSPGKTGALLFYEMPADIGPAALKAFGAKVIGVSDRPLMKRVQSPMSANLLRNRGGILTQETSNIFKGRPIKKGFLYIEPVIKREVFLVVGNKIRHSSLLLLPQRRRKTLT